MNCSICGKPIVLVPSAAERAKKHGGVPSDYSKLFTAHADCILRKRKEDTSKLIAKKRLEELRNEILAERISYSELVELESLQEHIEPDDVLLLQWAGVPE